MIILLFSYMYREEKEMIADRIKNLRISCGMTQSDLARKLNITRSSVNAWEMGISTPSTTYVVELSQLFHVSTDYLLGLEHSGCLDTDGLSEEEAEAVRTLLFALKKRTL